MVLVVFLQTDEAGLGIVHPPLDEGKRQFDDGPYGGEASVVLSLFGAKLGLASDPSFDDAVEDPFLPTGLFDRFGHMGAISEEIAFLLFEQVGQLFDLRSTGGGGDHLFGH